MNKTISCRVLRTAFLFFGLVTVFLSGYANENTQFERIAEYSSQVVKTKTSDKRYCAISFDAPNKSGDYYASELANLFDVFRSGVVTYASGMNVHKEIEIKLPNYSEDNLSLFFVGAIGSMEIKDNEGNVIGWRHNKYNIDTMFSDPIYNGTDYDRKHAPVIYLSQRQADKILESRNIIKEGDTYSKKQYESLIQTEVILNVEKDNCTYYIWNIFYNRGFYCEGLTDILGDFALTSYYQPAGHDLRQIHKSLYYFNEYSYYNQYLMRYLNERFPDETVAPSVITNNLVDDVDSIFLLSFFHNDSISSNHWIYTSLMVLAICLIAFSLLILFLLKKDNWIFVLVTFVSLFLPYCIFKFVFVVTKDVIFFSQPVCKLYALFVVIYIFAYLYRLIFVKKKNRSVMSLKYYEVYI